MENVWKTSAVPLPLSSYNLQNPPVTLSSSFPSPEFQCTFYPHATLTTTSHYEDTPPLDVSLSLPGERLSQQPRSHHLTKSQRRQQSHRKRANRCSKSGGGSDLGGRTGISCYSGGGGSTKSSHKGQETASHKLICDNEDDGINFDDSEEGQLMMRQDDRQKPPPLLNDFLRDEADINSHNKVSVSDRNFQNNVVRGSCHSTFIQKSSSGIVCRHENNVSANQRSSDSEKSTISNLSHSREFSISPNCIGGCNGSSSSRSHAIITKSRRLSNSVKSSTSRSTSSRSESLSPCSSSSNSSTSNSRISDKAGSSCNNITTTSNVGPTSLSPSSSSYCHHGCPSAPAAAAAAAAAASPVPLSIPQRLIPRLRRCSPVLSSSHIHQSHNHHLDEGQNTSSSSPPQATWLASCVEDRKRKKSRRSSTKVSNPKANPFPCQHEQQVEGHHPQGNEKQNEPNQNEEQEKDTEAGELKEEEKEEADASSFSLSLSDFSESSPNTPSSPLWTPSAARRRLRASTGHRFRSEGGGQRNSKTFNTTVHQLPAAVNNKTTARCLSSSERRSIRRKSVHNRARKSVVSHNNDKNKKTSPSLNSNSQNTSNIIITSNSSSCASGNSSRQTRFPSASSQHRRCAPLTRHWRPALTENSPKENFSEESRFIEPNLLSNQSIPTSEIHQNQQTQQLLLEDEDGENKNDEGDGEDEEDKMSRVVSPSSSSPPSLSFSSSSSPSSCLPCLSTSYIAAASLENPFASVEECRASHRVGKRSSYKQTESRGESLSSLGSAIPLDETTSQTLNSSSSSHSSNNSQRKSLRRRRSSSSGSHKNRDAHCSVKTKRSNEDEYVGRMSHSTSTDRIRAISATTVTTASTSTTTSTPTASTRAKTRCSDRTIYGEISSFSTPSTVSSQRLSSCQSPSYFSDRRYELQINSLSSSFSSSSMSSSSCSFTASASSEQTPYENGSEPSVSSRLVSAVEEKLKTDKEDNKEVYKQEEDEEENGTDLTSTTSITLASLGILPEYSKPSSSSSSSCLLTAAAESLLESSSPSSFLESPASASTAASPLPHDSSQLYYPYEGAAAKKERNLSIASSVDYISFSVSPRQSESPPRNSSHSSSSFPTHLSSPAIKQQNSCKTCYQCLSHPALFDSTAVNTNNLQDSPPNQMGFPTMASLPSTPPSGVGGISSHCCPRSSFRTPKRSHSETLRDKGNGMEFAALPFSSSSESSQTERQEGWEGRSGKSRGRSIEISAIEPKLLLQRPAI